MLNNKYKHCYMLSFCALLLVILFFPNKMVVKSYDNENSQETFTVINTQLIKNIIHPAINNQKKEAKVNISIEDEGWVSLGKFKITYYWVGEDEYGDAIARPCDGNHRAIEGHTIAVDPSVIPYGTEVMINGNIYVAEDCGGAVKGNMIDIFVDNPYMKLEWSEVKVRE